MKYIFISDQGHRKDTSGKNANGLYEYEFNQDVAERVNKLLDLINVINNNYTYNIDVMLLIIYIKMLLKNMAKIM